jgi:putative Mg2+ transporter-C (MgtC) family protein
MPLYPAWWELGLRLGSAILTGMLIGLDRGERGRPAGLRTMVLVCCTACLSMIQVNLLLPTAGRPAGSFNTLDLMRLPLGILSGMGFIGAGAILRKGDIVRGVTTAATLWIVTMLGLCFGGGQMALGFSGLAVSLGVVRGLRYVEEDIRQEHHARFTMVAAADGPTEENVRARLEGEGYKIVSCRTVRARGGWRVSWQVSWNGKHRDTHVPGLVDTLSAEQGIIQVIWAPEAVS